MRVTAPQQLLLRLAKEVVEDAKDDELIPLHAVGDDIASDGPKSVAIRGINGSYVKVKFLLCDHRQLNKGQPRPEFSVGRLVSWKRLLS
jgi:hypothetical protein